MTRDIAIKAETIALRFMMRSIARKASGYLTHSVVRVTSTRHLPTDNVGASIDTVCTAANLRVPEAVVRDKQQLQR